MDNFKNSRGEKMEGKNKIPIGVELVRRGLINENDVNKAIEYQRKHPTHKLGDVIHILRLCDNYELIKAIGEILDEKAILLQPSDVTLSVTDYISLDVAKQCMAIPFEIVGGKIKVCFADTSDRKAIDTVRLLLLNKGLVMERYITFRSNIEEILSLMQGTTHERIETIQDITSLVDSIIKNAIDKRASDVHIEPQEDGIRVRYRIDGELITVAHLEKDKQSQMIGRLKAISNMHQERQESQDGRILMYPDYNIRVSSQKNVNGEKFVLRLLKKNTDILALNELGFRKSVEETKKIFNKRNSITIIAAPTGEGKTTSLYSIIDLLNSPDINITTIEDPVEIRIPGLNQIEVDAKSTFSDSLRTVLRQDPDIILVGEIRDLETAEIAMQAGQTGHYVLSTIHTIDSIEVITRLRKMGVSNYDIASTLAVSVSQRLVRKVCKHCAKKRPFTEEEKSIMKSLGEKYGVTLSLDGVETYEPEGCPQCNNTGFYGRTAIFEVLEIQEDLKEMIINNESTIEIRKKAIEDGYQPLIVDGLQKIIAGEITLDELNRKLILY